MEVAKSSTTRTVEPAKSKPPVRTEDRAAQQKASEREAAQRKQQEQPKPVLNTQGHTTGRLLNVTA